MLRCTLKLRAKCKDNSNVKIVRYLMLIPSGIYHETVDMTVGLLSS